MKSTQMKKMKSNLTIKMFNYLINLLNKIKNQINILILYKRYL